MIISISFCFLFAKNCHRRRRIKRGTARVRQSEEAINFRKESQDSHANLSQSSGCVGCRPKSTGPTLITSVDYPSKGLKLQGRTVRKPSISEDFWTTSTREMDDSAVQSLGSISSISTLNQTLDPHGSSGSVNSPSEFVNHGLLLWNQTRQHWVGSKKSNRAQQVAEPKLSWNATYDSLLGSNKPFRQPIPLAEMVDFLVDIWEQEGMYD